MKKYLYSALALPLLFACSSENFDEKVISNDQFAGIEKVDATFAMEGETRFDGKDATGEAAWKAQEGDLWGFAWLGDGTKINPATDGIAYQNHNLIQKDNYFEPQTSIYVGKYFIYRPYDETTVSPQAINFNSLVDQPLAEGYESAKQPWKDLAKTAINIGDKWTDVIPGGRTYGTDPTVYDKPGIKQLYKLYAALFSNQTGLDLTYVKNNPTFASAKSIKGATDIDFKIAAGDAVGAADIYDVTVDLDGAANSFTYAPKAEPNGAAHSGTYWADKKNLGAGEGFTFTDDVITLTPADTENGLSTGNNGSKGWFWFNSLPVTAGDGVLGTAVETVLTTSYGVVTVNKTIGDCAYVFDKYNPADANPQWIKIDAADNATTTPKKWALTHNTFVNQYGNHKGKYALTVDFSAGKMNNMHIKNDTHLQKLLKYYIASGKTETVSLNLDGASATDKTFKISKNSIALLQSIPGKKVKVHACTTHNNPVKIIVTQDGSDGKTEVPELNDVFDATTDVYLAGGDTKWTWKQREGANQLKTDTYVNKIVNMGKLTVNASNIELTNGTLENAAGAEMTLTQVTTVKTNLTNLGTINVGSESNTTAELRAYNAQVVNDATGLDDTPGAEEFGIIYNYGVVGSTAGTTGEVHNYGYIKMMNNGAITLLKSNQIGGNFNAAWAVGNKMGIVELPEGNATALVSVSNATDQGFIKFKWTAKTYATPAGNVKYNTIIVSDDITFTAAENEIQYIEFDGTRTQVINPQGESYLPNLKGVYVHEGKSIIIEKNNKLDCAQGAYLGAKATIYKGGKFLKAGADFVTGDAAAANNYFGAWSLDQIVEY